MHQIQNEIPESRIAARLTGVGSALRVARLPLALCAACTLGLLVSAGCNTVKGVGEDVEGAGEGLQEVAEDAKDAIQD